MTENHSRMFPDLHKACWVEARWKTKSVLWYVKSTIRHCRTGQRDCRESGEPGQTWISRPGKELWTSWTEKRRDRLPWRQSTSGYRGSQTRPPATHSAGPVHGRNQNNRSLPTSDESCVLGHGGLYQQEKCCSHWRRESTLLWKFTRVAVYVLWVQGLPCAARERSENVQITWGNLYCFWLTVVNVVFL